MAFEPLPGRYSLQDASRVCELSANTIAALEARGEFPPRVAVPSVTGDAEGRKKQFIAREIDAWAMGLDWRALVAERLATSAAKGAS